MNLHGASFGVRGEESLKSSSCGFRSGAPCDMHEHFFGKSRIDGSKNNLILHGLVKKYWIWLGRGNTISG
jgi:hypothetical protein